MTLSYNKLKRVMKLLSSNYELKNAIPNLLKKDSSTIGDLITIILDTNIDVQKAAILTGKSDREIDEMESFEVIEVIADFFHIYIEQLAEIDKIAQDFRLPKPNSNQKYIFERFERNCRKSGLNSLDFQNMTFPELYLQYCLEYEEIREINEQLKG